MAMALAETGRFDDAVLWQERAIAAALTSGSAGGIEQLQGQLGRY